ncbi:hypothetical protein BCR33DRAFT_814826 [Rhizoclosmatium globosum]|uniref:MFS general substrate transporter n=1 Tax=Rhizoclosmatium globosum TaxID=329046 RepID=A0A1Y2D1J4_9FUNG|nr:hypothetical protein BCR33DRAFT_814826 [Rhizoclosmatium globosum]|eukprot:ORY52984.1 hypothetical protein BCR33DRAFT_814826 [Rhizoclosmatium globosum]
MGMEFCESYRMFSMSAVFLVAFAVFQLKVANTPLIPQNVLLNKQVVTFAIISFMSSAVLYVITYFSPFYVEFVYDMAPMNTSLIGLSFTLTCVTASMFSGYYFSRTGRFDVFFVVGPYSTRCQWLPWLNLQKKSVFCILDLQVRSLVLALDFFAVTLLCFTFDIDRDLIATSTGFISAAMGMGGNIAIVVMGTIINNFIGPYAAGYSELQESIATLNSMGIHASVSDFSSLKKTLLTIASVNATTQPLFEKSAIQITEAFHSAVNIGFYALIPYMVVILCLTPLIWQKKRSENDRKLVKSNLESS